MQILLRWTSGSQSSQRWLYTSGRTLWKIAADKIEAILPVVAWRWGFSHLFFRPRSWHLILLCSLLFNTLQPLPMVCSDSLSERRWARATRFPCCFFVSFPWCSLLWNFFARHFSIVGFGTESFSAAEVAHDSFPGAELSFAVWGQLGLRMAISWRMSFKDLCLVWEETMRFRRHICTW